MSGRDVLDLILVGPPTGEREFAEWRWEPMARLPELIIPFKRPVYEKVVTAFRHLGA